MADSINDQGQPVEVANYAFHDPEFISWWLGSLYLLPLDIQFEVAQTLRGSVHRPDALRVLDEFIGATAAAIDATGGHSVAPEATTPAGPVEQERPVTATGMLAWMWRRSPVATALGFGGIGLLAVKSVLALFGVTTVF